MPELRTYSLHRRLIVWLVIPMLVMSGAILVEAYVSASESAQAIYDRLLLGLAFSISEHTVITEGDLLSDEVLDLMTQRTSDTIAYRVTGPDGAFVTGLHGIPPIPDDRTLEGGVPLFYNAVFEGEPVRMVALSLPIPTGAARSSTASIATPRGRRAPRTSCSVSPASSRKRWEADSRTASTWRTSAGTSPASG